MSVLRGDCVEVMAGMEPGNPAHLFLGTPADNSEDRRAKGRSCTSNGGTFKPGTCPRFPVVSAETAEAVIADLRAGLRVTDVVRKYGISFRTAGCIRDGKHWTQVAKRAAA